MLEWLLIILGLIYLLNFLYQLVRTEYSGSKPVAIRPLSDAETNDLRARADRAAVADLQSRVYRIRGRVMPQRMRIMHPMGMVLMNEDDLKEASRIAEFKVGALTFDADMVSLAYQQIVQELKYGAIVEVEYSPRTKRVWSVHKIDESAVQPVPLAR